MDEDREQPTPWVSGRETIGHGLQATNGPSEPALSVPVPNEDSARNVIIEERSTPVPPQQDPWPVRVPSPPNDDDDEPANQSTAANGSANDGPLAHASPQSGEAQKSVPGIAIETVLTDGVQGFSEQANACANKAAQFAYHLKHAMIGSDHLMLALTLDENARPLLAAFGNVQQLRESAARILGETNAKYLGAPARSDAFDPVLTDDLFEIFANARRAAAGRCQQVAVSDLVNAFPQQNGKLVYGRVETVDPVPAVAERLERRISEFLTTFERRLMDDMQRQLTGLVRDFGSALSARLDEIAPIDDAPPREIAQVPNAGVEIAGSTASEGPPIDEKRPEGFWERCGWNR